MTYRVADSNEDYTGSATYAFTIGRRAAAVKPKNTYYAPAVKWAVEKGITNGTDATHFDPDATWKKKTINNFTAKELQKPIFVGGRLVYDMPSLEEIQQYCADQMETMWDEVKRFDNPHNYYVDLSQKLWDIKYDLLTHNK